MGLFHKFKSPVADDPSPQSATLVKPSNWNEEHLLDPALYLRQFYTSPIFTHELITVDERPWRLYNPFYPYYYPDEYPNYPLYGSIREPLQSELPTDGWPIIGAKTFTGTIGLSIRTRVLPRITMVVFKFLTLGRLRIGLGFPPVLDTGIYADLALYKAYPDNELALSCTLRWASSGGGGNIVLKNFDRRPGGLVFYDRFGVIILKLVPEQRQLSAYVAAPDFYPASIFLGSVFSPPNYNHPDSDFSVATVEDINNPTKPVALIDFIGVAYGEIAGEEIRYGNVFETRLILKGERGEL
jgi:hypothetical protein